MAIETEKKFLLAHIPSPLMTNGVPICQGYLKKSKNGVVRVRVFGSKGFLTVKGPTTNGARKEFEYPVPMADARQMMALFCKGATIDKTRFHIKHEGFEWEVDVFAGTNKGLVVAEIELEHIDQKFQKPDWIGREVTHDPRYFNSNLIEHPFCTWPASNPSMPLT